jgi:hypothetical protein
MMPTCSVTVWSFVEVCAMTSTSPAAMSYTVEGVRRDVRGLWQSGRAPVSNANQRVWD